MQKSLSIAVFSIFLVSYVLFAGSFAAQGKVGQCADGIDNDGDGLVDWQYDLGCYNQLDPTEGGHPSRYIEDGWSVFEPSKDTRIIYVSSSEGKNSNDGLSPQRAKKTVKAGKALLRKGYPDWLLFKRGDVWKDQELGFWSKSGRSKTEPLVVSSYGNSTARPRFETTSPWWRAHTGGAPEINHLSIVGLHAYIYSKDPNNSKFTGLGPAAFSWLVGGGDLLLEDNKFEYGQVGLATDPTSEFVLRRNILLKNYSITRHAQSLFTHIKAPLLIEENLFYHGGWNDEFRFVVTPNAEPASWALVSNGCFDIELEGKTYSVTGIDFTGVASMDAVAAKIDLEINKQTGGGISFKWTRGGVFVLKSTRFESDKNYSITKYSGSEAGTDIFGPSYINGASVRIPESTIYNRNMYLSAGYGNTTVRGNIDADGASGGVQLRMGGLVEDNLFLQNPHAVVFGHGENPAESITSGIIRDNVVLNSRDIDTQKQGSGILVVGTAKGKYRATYAQDIEVYNNIVAHNRLGTFNVKAYSIDVKTGSRDILVHDNIAYNWHSHMGENDDRGPLMNIAVTPGVENVKIWANDFQNPERGMLATARNGDFSGVTMFGNRYYSASPDPGTTRVGWFAFNRGRGKKTAAWHSKLYAKWLVPNGILSSSAWFAESGEVGYNIGLVEYPDPTRDITTYMRSLGKDPTLEAFISEASNQSKYNWRKEFTAHRVNEYIREGFGLVFSKTPGKQFTVPPPS